MKSLLLAVAAGAALVSSAGVAQAPAGGFGQRDQTRAEAQQRADMMFQLVDLNKDGIVTKAEAQQALAQFQQMGGGGDNGGRRAERMQRMLDQAFGTATSLTRRQFEAQALARFDAADLNHDGTLTAAEREQGRTMRRGGAAGAGAGAAPVGTATPQ